MAEEANSISINGSRHELPGGGATVAQMLERAAVRQRHIAVALNGAIVPRGEHASQRLKPGDSLEIVQPAGGGL